MKLIFCLLWMIIGVLVGNVIWPPKECEAQTVYYTSPNGQPMGSATTIGNVTYYDGPKNQPMGSAIVINPPQGYAQPAPPAPIYAPSTPTAPFQPFTPYTFERLSK